MVSLTIREEEIMKILTKNPMIPQEELANILNISRSATAVHISNLIKKGKIVGRGYVLSQPKNIILIGRIISRMLVENSQNIKFEVKGIGYLLSKGLAKMGEKVTLISALGEDLLGRAILAELDLEGIDKKHLQINENLPSAMEVKVEGNRTMAPGVLQTISEELIGAKEHLLKNAHTVINDCSCGIKVCFRLLFLCKRYSLKSINILNDVADITPFFKTDILIKMNTIIMKKQQLQQLGISQILFEELINQNIFPQHTNGEIIILCEKEGVLVATKTDVKHISLLPGQKMTDQFLVGFIYGLINGYSLSQAVRIGLGNFQQLLKQV